MTQGNESAEQTWWGHDDPDGTSWKTGSPSTEERKEAFVEWMLTPEGERQPRTRSELAEVLGVTTQTLRNYEKSTDVQRELVRRGRALDRVSRAPQVLDSLYRQATDTDNPRSVQAAKTWLDWLSKQVDSDRPQDLADLSDEEVLELAMKLTKDE